MECDAARIRDRRYSQFVADAHGMDRRQPVAVDVENGVDARVGGAAIISSGYLSEAFAGFHLVRRDDSYRLGLCGIRCPDRLDQSFGVADPAEW